MKNKENIDVRKYLGMSFALALALIIAMIFFFAIDKISDVSKFFNGIVKTLMPFLIGGCLAYIICPMVNILYKFYFKLFSKVFKKASEEKRNSYANSFSIYSGIIIAILTLLFIVIMIIPNLAKSVIRIIQLMPDAIQRLINFLEHTIKSNDYIAKNSELIINKGYDYAMDFLNTNVIGNINNIVTNLTSGFLGVFSLIFNILIGFIVAIYLLFMRKKLARQGKMIIYSIADEKEADSIMDEIEFVDKIFSGFITGKILDAVVIAIICYFLLLLYRLFNPNVEVMNEVMIAVIVGIFNVIPFFGWYVAWIIGFLLCLIVNPGQAIYFLIFNFILQQVDGNIIGPRILGDNTGISGFWVLFAILLFGHIWGFFGMLIGVPVFAVAYHFIKKAIFRGLLKKGQFKMAVDYEKDYAKKESEKFTEKMKATYERIKEERQKDDSE